jgi:hypothetical protein
VKEIFILRQPHVVFFFFILLFVFPRNILAGFFAHARVGRFTVPAAVPSTAAISGD